MNSLLLDNPQILKVLFHPKPEKSSVSSEEGVIPVEVEVESQVCLRGLLYPTVSPTAPVILFFHGNGEVATDYDDLAEFFTTQNISLCVLDYRGYGRSDGTPTATNLVMDSIQMFPAFRGLLARNQLSPEKIYIMGRSLGSVPAIAIAAKFSQELSGLIIDSGFVDTCSLIRRLGGKCHTFDDNLEGFGNGKKLFNLNLPVLILHGEDDTLIPISEAEELYSCCASDHKFLVKIPEAGHNTIMIMGMAQGNPMYFKAIYRFIFDLDKMSKESELYFQGEEY